MEWISVKDRLPPDGQQVLLFIQAQMQDVDCDTNEPISDLYIHTEKAIGYITKNTLWINYDQDGYYSLSDVTHWMPLPTPPFE